MGGQRGLVLLTQPDGSLVVRAVSNYPESLVNHRVPAGAGQAGMIAATGKAHAAQNYPEMANLISDLHGDFPSDGVLYGVPLSYRGQVRGVLQVVSSGLSSEEVNDRLSVLMMLAPQVATAIVKAQLHDTISEDREQLRAILEHAGVAVAVWDTSGKIHLVNPEAQRLLNVLGYSPDLFKEKPPRHVIETLLPLNMTLEDLGSVIEINLGEVGQYLLHIAPIALPGSTRYVGVAQEVSELRRLDRMKSDLIQILSHDLRNPLGLARGAVDLMVDPSTPIENRPQLVEMMVSSMERMELLISDVVDLDMAEDMGTETAMPYTLSLVVNRVIRQNKPKAERHSLTLSYHEEQAPGHHMFGHGILVGQMVDNLVNNAIKYTPAGGTIDVMLNVEGDNAVIRVKDTGFGISAEHLPHIFDQFYRVRDDRTRSVEGTGLGLHLVRKIAQAHGGRVTVESAVGVGSTFTILLPLYLTPETQPITTIKRVDLSNYVKRDV
jgi:signal transduction histidine kinase